MDDPTPFFPDSPRESTPLPAAPQPAPPAAPQPAEPADGAAPAAPRIDPVTGLPKRGRGRPRKIRPEEMTAPGAAAPAAPAPQAFTAPARQPEASVPMHTASEWIPGDTAGRIPDAQPHADTVREPDADTIHSSSDWLDARERAFTASEVNEGPLSGSNDELLKRRDAAARIKMQLDSTASSIDAMNNFFNSMSAPAPQRGEERGAPGPNGDRRVRFERKARFERNNGNDPRPNLQGGKPYGQRPGYTPNPQERGNPNRPGPGGKNLREPYHGPNGNRPAPSNDYQTSAAYAENSLSRNGNAAGYAPHPMQPRTVKLFDLQALSTAELMKRVEEQNLYESVTLQGKHDLINALLREHVRRGGSVEGEGFLEIWQEGIGFLRSPYGDLKTCPEDIAVPPQMIAANGLRPGDHIVCRARMADQKQRGGRLTASELISVNGMQPEQARRVPPLSALPVAPATRPLRVRTPDAAPLLAGLDALTPFAFGHRAILIGPRHLANAELLCAIAHGIARNHPDAEVYLALINAAPEMVNELDGDPAYHLLATEFDDFPDKHLQMAGNLTDLARRKVESGRDVIILMDSIIGLSRAYGIAATTQQGIPSDGIDGRAIQKARRLFGAGRAIRDGGSLTVIVTANTSDEINPSDTLNARILQEFAPTASNIVWLQPSKEDATKPMIDVSRLPAPAQAARSQNDAERQASAELRAALAGGADPEDAIRTYAATVPAPEPAPLFSL